MVFKKTGATRECLREIYKKQSEEHKNPQAAIKKMEK